MATLEICREKCNSLKAPFFTWRGPGSVPEAKRHRCYCKSAKLKAAKREGDVYSGLSKKCCPISIDAINQHGRALYSHLEVQCPDGSCHRVRPTSPLTEEETLDPCLNTEAVCGVESVSRDERAAMCSKRCPQYKDHKSGITKFMHKCGNSPSPLVGRCLGSSAVCDKNTDCANTNDESAKACAYSKYW